MVWFGFGKKDTSPQDAALQDAAPSAVQDQVAPSGPQDAAPFELVIEDVFTITGRGTVVTGRVASGSARVGDPLTVSRGGVAVFQTRLKAVEMFRKIVQVANAGDNVGLLLDGLRREDLAAGDRITP